MSSASDTESASSQPQATTEDGRFAVASIHRSVINTCDLPGDRGPRSDERLTHDGRWVLVG